MIEMSRCSACDREVSPKAEVCPGCGHPLAAERDMVAGRRVQTIERTSKHYKGLILIGASSICVGVFSCVASCNENPTPWWGTVGLWFFMAGVMLYVGARIAAWWHHG